MSVRVQVFVSVPVFNSFGYVPGDEIAESRGPILTPVLMCVWFFFPTPLSRFLISAEHPAIWLDSDTIYLEKPSDPTG